MFFWKLEKGLTDLCQPYGVILACSRRLLRDLVKRLVPPFGCPGPSHSIHVGVVQDREQPLADVRAGPEALPAFVGLQKRVVDEVLRFVESRTSDRAPYRRSEANWPSDIEWTSVFFGHDRYTPPEAFHSRLIEKVFGRCPLGKPKASIEQGIRSTCRAQLPGSRNRARQRSGSFSFRQGCRHANGCRAAQDAGSPASPNALARKAQARCTPSGEIA